MFCIGQCKYIFETYIIFLVVIARIESVNDVEMTVGPVPGKVWENGGKFKKLKNFEKFQRISCG